MDNNEKKEESLIFWDQSLKDLKESHLKIKNILKQLTEKNFIENEKENKTIKKKNEENKPNKTKEKNIKVQNIIEMKNETNKNVESEKGEKNEEKKDLIAQEGKHKEINEVKEEHSKIQNDALSKEEKEDKDKKSEKNVSNSDINTNEKKIIIQPNLEINISEKNEDDDIIIKDKLKIEHINNIENIIQKKLDDEDNYYADYYNSHCGCVCHYSYCCLKEEKKNQIEQLEKAEKEFDIYFPQKKTEIKFDWKIFKDIKIILFTIFIFIHYFVIAQINSVMYSLFGEAKRCSSIYFNILDKKTTKSFYDFITNSNTNDVSQIDFFYLSSLLTSFLLNIFSEVIIYFICLIINIIVLLRIYFIEYKSPEKTKKYENYNINEFLLYVVAPLIALYLFTGLIASIPFYLKKNKKSLLSYPTLLINLISVLSVIIKLLICEYTNFVENFLLKYMILYFIGFGLLIIFIIIFGCNKKKIENPKEEILIDYKSGKLMISSELIQISIRTKKYLNYYCSFFNRELVFLIIVNLCSRISILKFKTEYKNNFQKEENSSIWFIILTFFGSFIISIVNINLVGKCDNYKCCYSKEAAFSSFIFLENILIFVFSLINWGFESTKGLIKWITYVAIFISGSINFVFSEYFSYKYINYMSISGIVSIPQVIFSIIELFLEPFENNNSYWIQIISSLIGMITVIIYYCVSYYSFVKCCNLKCCLKKDVTIGPIRSNIENDLE